MNKSWRQHPTKQQLDGHLSPITKTIQVRRTRHAEFISDVLLWTPSHGRAKAGRPTWTYIQQLCANTGYSLEDISGVKVAGEGRRDPCLQYDMMMMMIHTQIYIYTHAYIYIYIYIYTLTHTHTYIYIYMYLHTHTYIYIYIRTYIFSHVCVCIYIFLHTHIHIYIYVNMFMHIHTLTHLYIYI